MRRGNVLLILLIVLLLASSALLQLTEDHYLAHLTYQHVNDFSVARKTLRDAFNRLTSSTVSPACYSTTMTCSIQVSGTTVNYMLYELQREKESLHYLQYTLSTKRGAVMMTLCVIVEPLSNKIVSWIYPS